MSKKILFLTRYEPFDLMLESFAKSREVVCLQYEKSKFTKDIKGVKTIQTAYCTWGIHYLVNEIFHIQLSIPIWIKSLSKTLETEKPDQVVAVDFYHWSFLQAVTYKKKHPTVQLILLSETKAFPANRLSKVFFKAFFYYLRRHIKMVNLIIVPTQQGLDFFREHLSQAPVELLPAPVDTEHFVSKEKKEWLEDNTLHVLMNARYVSFKRHEDLLQAAVQLRKDGKKFHLTFIGRDGAGRVKVEQQVNTFGLDEFVTFLPSIRYEDLPSLYQNHDVLVLPSYNEAIGMVVPEAMACGIPTITSETVGANVYVKNDVTGYIVSTKNVAAFSRALTLCFERKNLSRLGAAARERVANFTPEILAGRFATILAVDEL